MFSGCTGLESLNVSSWDTSTVTTTAYMFADCTNLKTITGIGSWNVSSVSNSMDRMFKGCSSLTSLDLSGWGATTGNVKKMSEMFANCTALETLNLTGWDVSSVTTMGAMFQNCVKLRQITSIGGWNPISVTTTGIMFDHCDSLVGPLNLSGWQTNNLSYIKEMFNHCVSLTGLNLSGWNTSGISNMQGVFSMCYALQSLNVSGWRLNTSSAIGMGGMFAGCGHLMSIDLSGWDMTNVGMVNFLSEDLMVYEFFGHCDSLRQIRTPLYLNAELQANLPAAFSRQDSPGVTYTMLPTQQSASYTITRGSISFGEATFTLPSGTTAVEANAFEGVYMSVVSIPSGCSSIGDYAFKDCVQLMRSRIPANCTLGTDVFAGCPYVFVFGAENSPAYQYCQTHDNCEFVLDTQN